MHTHIHSGTLESVAADVFKEFQLCSLKIHCKLSLFRTKHKSKIERILPLALGKTLLRSLLMLFAVLTPTGEKTWWDSQKGSKPSNLF